MGWVCVCVCVSATLVYCRWTHKRVEINLRHYAGPWHDPEIKRSRSPRVSHCAAGVGMHVDWLLRFLVLRSRALWCGQSYDDADVDGSAAVQAGPAAWTPLSSASPGHRLRQQRLLLGRLHAHQRPVRVHGAVVLQEGREHGAVRRRPAADDPRALHSTLRNASAAVTPPSTTGAASSWSSKLVSHGRKRSRLSHRIRRGTTRCRTAPGVKAATHGAVPYRAVPNPGWKNVFAQIQNMVRIVVDSLWPCCTVWDNKKYDTFLSITLAAKMNRWM